MQRHLAFILLALPGYSHQTRARAYEPGYVVRANGDMLNGAFGQLVGTDFVARAGAAYRLGCHLAAPKSGLAQP